MRHFAPSLKGCEVMAIKRGGWIAAGRLGAPGASFEQGGGGGEGVLDPKLGVPKMA